VIVEDLPQAGAHDVPDYVLRYIALLGLLAVVWLGLKALARRGALVRLYRTLDPWVQAVRAWVFGAPAVFTYLAIWTTTSVIQQGQPSKLADLNAALSSTNLVNLAEEPLRVLFASAMLVADQAWGFLLYVIVYLVIVARLEHRLGAARWIMVAAASHVLGSLLTVTLERLGIVRDLLPGSIAVTQDVGVSYVMVGSLGAYLWLVTPKWRWPYVAAVGLGIIGPVIVSHTIWDVGHLLATTCGTVFGWLAMRWPTRDPLHWRQLVRGLPPRVLPTFDATIHRALPSASSRE
jgi:hypothetical protein